MLVFICILSFNLKAQNTSINVKNVNTVTGLITILTNNDPKTAVLSFTLLVIPPKGDPYQIQHIKGTSMEALRLKTQAFQVGYYLMFSDIIIQYNNERFAKNMGNRNFILK